ncbi:hypothetical protein XELAEV_18001956mg [Xenopus laevis]|uniref:Uncharacterized protein n=1 Tax=Xenopus laevis TaxID=8355 RepID=A0A974BP93_XENLA|nr:hypothetical protein XELAEV_18001956mg [Xenopus laevis]
MEPACKRLLLAVFFRYKLVDNRPLLSFVINISKNSKLHWSKCNVNVKLNVLVLSWLTNYFKSCSGPCQINIISSIDFSQ